MWRFVALKRCWPADSSLGVTVALRMARADVSDGREREDKVAAPCMSVGNAFGYGCVASGSDNWALHFM